MNSLLNLLYADDALEALAVVGDGHARDAAGLARDLRAVCRADSRVLHTVACALDALVVLIEQPQVEALAHAERDIRQGEVIAALGCVLEAAADDELGRLAAHVGDDGRYAGAFGRDKAVLVHDGDLLVLARPLHGLPGGQVRDLDAERLVVQAHGHVGVVQLRLEAGGCRRLARLRGVRIRLRGWTAILR